MTTLTRIKVVLALIGIAAFGLGARFEQPSMRWAGIGVVAVAWLLRFAGPRNRDDSAPERE
jgi:hypothetical protein